MATQPIDYTALAKQYGATSSTPAPGKVDYAALAKQYGATSSTPAPDSQTVAGAGSYGVPQLPANPPANMQPSILGRDASPGTATQRLLGDKPISNTLSVVGSHLKNMVAAPYHAFTDAPQTPVEMGVQGAQGPAALGLYRMFVKPTIQSGGAAIDAARSGDYTAAANNAMDAVPIAGPWARGVENDAKTYGAIPALFGLGTDIYVPKVGAKLFSGATNAVGKGAQLAATTPEAAKIAGTRTLVTGSPGEMLNRSLKPPVSMPDFEQSIEASLPKIAAQNPQGVSGFADAAKNSQAAEQDWYRNLTDPLRPFEVDASPIADAQMKSIPIMNRVEDPPTLQGGSPGTMKTVTVPAGEGTKMTMGGIVGAKPAQLKGGIYNDTAAIANNYRRPMPLGVIDDVRQDSNAKLNAFFNKAGGDRNAALSNPETSRVAAVNSASRDLAYDNFSRLSAAGRTDGGVPASEIAANQNLYGQLSDVAQVAGKRATVAGRANPLSLQESLQLHGNPVSQAYNFGTSRLFKNLTNSDAVTNAAVDRFKYPNTLNLPARPGLFPQTASTLGKVIEKTGAQAPKLSRYVAPLLGAQATRRGSR